MSPIVNIILIILKLVIGVSCYPNRGLLLLEIKNRGLLLLEIGDLLPIQIKSKYLMFFYKKIVRSDRRMCQKIELNVLLSQSALFSCHAVNLCGSFLYR